MGGYRLLLLWLVHRTSCRCGRILGSGQSVIGTTLDIKVAPTPLSDRDLKLLLSCWTRWDATTVAGSALATWLCDVQSEYGPECDDSPHFRRRDIDLLEATRLLNDSGFQFLPERALQDQSVMGMVMSIGLRLCALEVTLEQLQTLSYLTVTGLLPGPSRTSCGCKPSRVLL